MRIMVASLKSRGLRWRGPAMSMLPGGGLSEIRAVVWFIWFQGICRPRLEWARVLVGLVICAQDLFVGQIATRVSVRSTEYGHILLHKDLGHNLEHGNQRQLTVKVVSSTPPRIRFWRKLAGNVSKRKSTRRFSRRIWIKILCLRPHM